MAKPDPSLKPDWNIYYDAILCHSQYEASYLKVYSKTILIGPLNNKITERNPKKGKPNLLYLPTYGTLSSIDELLETLKELKTNYNLIIKLHHGTTFLNDEKNRVNELKYIADECYDLTTSLSELLAKSDVVLSDNSGAIFEALYNNIPVAIFSNNINKKLGDFDTIQYELVSSGIIPYTNNPNNINQVLSAACSTEYIEKQNKISDELFYNDENSQTAFLNIIKNFIDDNINLKYKQLHDVLLEDYRYKSNSINKLNSEKASLLNKINFKNQQIDNLRNLNSNSEEIINKLNNNINDLNNKIKQQDLILYEYNNFFLYKLARKIYKVYFKIFKGKKK